MQAVLARCQQQHPAGGALWQVQGGSSWAFQLLWELCCAHPGPQPRVRTAGAPPPPGEVRVKGTCAEGLSWVVFLLGQDDTKPSVCMSPWPHLSTDLAWAVRSPNPLSRPLSRFQCQQLSLAWNRHHPHRDRSIIVHCHPCSQVRQQRQQTTPETQGPTH